MLDFLFRIHLYIVRDQARQQQILTKFLRRFRSKDLEELQGILFKQQLEFNNLMINKENNVLFENKTQDEDQFFGRNQYMVPVFVKNNLIKLEKLGKFLYKMLIETIYW